MDYLIKRKPCSKCNKNTVRLINDDVCLKCYQADYYQKITKKRRKSKKNIVNNWYTDCYKDFKKKFDY